MTNNLKKLKKGVIKAFGKIKDRPQENLEVINEGEKLDDENLQAIDAGGDWKLAEGCLKKVLEDVEKNSDTKMPMSVYFHQLQIERMHYIVKMNEIYAFSHKLWQDLDGDGEKKNSGLADIKEEILNSIGMACYDFIETGIILSEIRQGDYQNIWKSRVRFRSDIIEYFENHIDFYTSPHSNMALYTSRQNMSEKRKKTILDDSFWVDQLPELVLRDGILRVWIPYSTARINECIQSNRRIRNPKFLYLIQRIITGAKSEGITDVKIYMTPCPNVYNVLKPTDIGEIKDCPKAFHEMILNYFRERSERLGDFEYTFFNNIVCAVELLYPEEIQGLAIQAGMLSWPNIYSLMTEDEFKKFIHIGYYVAFDKEYGLTPELGSDGFGEENGFNDFKILGFDICHYIDKIRYDVDMHVVKKHNASDTDRLISALYLMEEVLVVDLMLKDKRLNEIIEFIALNEWGNTCVNKVFEKYNETKKTLWITEEEMKDEEAIIEDVQEENEAEEVAVEGQYEAACRQEDFDTFSLPIGISHKEFECLWKVVSHNSYEEFIQHYDLAANNLSCLIGLMTSKQYHQFPNNVRELICTYGSRTEYLMDYKGLTFEHIQAIGATWLEWLLNRKSSKFDDIDRLVRASVPISDLVKLQQWQLGLILNKSVGFCRLVTHAAYSDIFSLEEHMLHQILDKVDRICRLWSGTNVRSPHENRLIDLIFDKKLCHRLCYGHWYNRFHFHSPVFSESRSQFSDITHLEEPLLNLILDKVDCICILLKFGVPFSDIIDLEQSKLHLILDESSLSFHNFCKQLRDGVAFSDIIKFEHTTLNRLINNNYFLNNKPYVYDDIFNLEEPIVNLILDKMDSIYSLFRFGICFKHIINLEEGKLRLILDKTDRICRLRMTDRDVHTSHEKSMLDLIFGTLSPSRFGWTMCFPYSNFYESRPQFSDVINLEEPMLNLILDKVDCICILFKFGVPFSDIINLEQSKLHLILDESSLSFHNFCKLLRVGAAFRDIIKFEHTTLNILINNYIFVINQIRKGRDILNLEEPVLNLILDKTEKFCRLLTVNIRFRDIINIEKSKLHLILDKVDRICNLLRVDVPFSDIINIEQNKLHLILDEPSPSFHNFCKVLRVGVAISDIIDLEESMLHLIIDNTVKICRLLSADVTFSDIIDLEQSKLHLVLDKVDHIYRLLRVDVPFSDIINLEETKLHLILDKVDRICNLLSGGAAFSVVINLIDFDDIIKLEELHIDRLVTNPSGIFGVARRAITSDDIRSTETPDQHDSLLDTTFNYGN